MESSSRARSFGVDVAGARVTALEYPRSAGGDAAATGAATMAGAGSYAWTVGLVFSSAGMSPPVAGAGTGWGLAAASWASLGLSAAGVPTGRMVSVRSTVASTTSARSDTRPFKDMSPATPATRTSDAAAAQAGWVNRPRENVPKNRLIAAQNPVSPSSSAWAAAAIRGASRWASCKSLAVTDAGGSACGNDFNAWRVRCRLDSSARCTARNRPTCEWNSADWLSSSSW